MPEHQYVQIGEARWHVVTAGPPDAPAVVLLHGWPQTWWCWRDVIERVAATHRVIAPDLRGFGDSDAPPGRYDKAGLADDVVALLDALGVERAVVAGHDWGGFVAWLVALRAPERVQRLVALSIVDPWFVPERSLRGVASAWYQLAVVTPGINGLVLPRVGRLLRGAGAVPWSPEDARRYEAQYRDRPAHVRAAASLYRTFAAHELPAMARGRYAPAPRAAMPVTVATGAEDFVVGPERIRGARADDLRVEVLAGAGHFLPEERPRDVAALILHR